MRVVWAALALLLLLPGGVTLAAEDGVVNRGNAQHLGPGDDAERPRPNDRVSDPEKADEVDSAHDALLGVDETTDDEAAAADRAAEQDDRDAWNNDTVSGYADMDEFAGEPDWGFHDSACGCARCRRELEFFGPLPTANTHPPAQLFLTPTPEGGAVLEDGCGFMRFDLDVSSIITRELDSGTIADYDMETWRVTANYHQGTGGGEFFAKLPISWRGPGVMDSVIRSWHGFFSLPNGLRDTLPDDQYHFVIVTRDGPVLNDQGGMGLGDLTVGYKLPLWGGADSQDAAALRAQVKLPTGQAPGFSSGNIDAALGLLYHRQLSPHWRAFTNVDYILIGEPDLENIEHQSVSNVMVGTEFALSRRMTLVGQYQVQGNPLRIGGREADKSSHQLSLGFNRRLGDSLVWSGGFSEDIYPETAPDFVMVTNFKWEF